MTYDDRPMATGAPNGQAPTQEEQDKLTRVLETTAKLRPGCQPPAIGEPDVDILAG